MRVALDIDDTITRHPAFFAFLSRALRAAGHEVIVITFRQDRDSAEADLAALNVAYDDLHVWSDREPPESILQWKGRLCADLGIDVYFEDDVDVLAHVPGSVVAMQVR